MAFINPENYGLYSNVVLGPTFFRSKNRTPKQKGWDDMMEQLRKTFFKKVTVPYAVYMSVGPIEYLEQPICKVSDDHRVIIEKKGLRIYLWEPISTYDTRKGKNNNTYVPYTHEESEFIRSYELDSIEQWVQRNELTNVMVYAPNSTIKQYFQYKYPDIDLDCTPVGWVYPATVEFSEKDLNADPLVITKKIWCGNWRYASHRHCIASYITNEFDAEQYNLSWIYKSTPQILLNNSFGELPQKQKLLDGANKLGKLSPLALDRTIEKQHDIDEYIDINMDTNPKESYQECAIAVVNETRFAEMTPLLTEKIMNAMLNCRPFIMVGPPGNLEYMRRWGFSTFNDVFDESYDKEKDHTKRLQMIFDLLDKINSMTMDEIRDLYMECYPGIIHNFYHIMELQDSLIGKRDESGKLVNLPINKNKIWKRIRDAY